MVNHVCCQMVNAAVVNFFSKAAVIIFFSIASVIKWSSQLSWRRVKLKRTRASQPNVSEFDWASPYSVSLCARSTVGSLSSVQALPYLGARRSTKRKDHRTEISELNLRLLPLSCFCYPSLDPLFLRWSLSTSEIILLCSSPATAMATGCDSYIVCTPAFKHYYWNIEAITKCKVLWGMLLGLSRVAVRK